VWTRKVIPVIASNWDFVCLFTWSTKYLWQLYTIFVIAAYIVRLNRCKTKRY